MTGEEPQEDSMDKFVNGEDNRNSKCSYQN